MNALMNKIFLVLPISKKNGSTTCQNYLKEQIKTNKIDKKTVNHLVGETLKYKYGFKHQLNVKVAILT